MKVLFKSFYLYFLGVLADGYKRAFDTAVDKCIAKGGDISSRRLTRMSDISYGLYRRFRDMEKEVRRELA